MWIAYHKPSTLTQRRYHLWYLYFLSFFLFAPPLFAASNPHPTPNIIALEQNITILHDQTNTLSPQAVVLGKYDEQFSLPSNLSLALDAPNTTYWIRIPSKILPPSGSTVWALDAHWPDFFDWFSITQFSLHARVSPNSSQIHTQDGLKKERPFTIFLQKFSGQTLYLQASSRLPCQLPLRLVTQKKLRSEENSRLLINGIYYGLLLAIIFYHIVIFISLKDFTFLWYTLSVVSTAVYFLANSGILSSWLALYPGTAMHRLEPASLTLMFASLVMFCSLFIKAPTYAPKVHTALTCYSVCGLLWVSCAAIVPISIYNNLTVLYATVAICSFLSAIYCYKQGNLHARYFVWSFLPYLVGGPITLLSFLRVTPYSPWQHYTLQITSTTHLCLFALCLGQQVRDLRKEREKAHAANEAKNEFLATMSHEIRTPLNAVIGLTDQVLTTNLKTEQRDALETVQRSSDHLLDLLSDILDFSQIEAGQLSIEKHPFNLYTLLNAIHLSLKPTADGKQIRLLLKIHPGTPVTVIGDQLRLRQVLTNVIVNGIKYTPTGSVCLTVSPSPKSSATDIQFSVSDTGIGISEEKLESIFERFQQNTAGHDKIHGGVGLGLTISRKLVTLMQGSIAVQSQLQHGSTFTISLPLPTAPMQQPVKPSNNVMLSSLHCLIVDDSAINRKVSEMHLHSLGHTSISVESGEKAIEAVCETYFDLIIMDIEMPGIGGIEAIKTIRKSNVDSTIMALSAHALPEYEQKALQSGANVYVTKPIKLQQLRETIEQLFP